jgi:hypothetical protein
VGKRATLRKVNDAGRYLPFAGLPLFVLLVVAACETASAIVELGEAA